MYDSQDREPVGQEFGHTFLEDLPPVTISTVKAEHKPIEAKDCHATEVIQHMACKWNVLLNHNQNQTRFVPCSLTLKTTYKLDVLKKIFYSL